MFFLGPGLRGYGVCILFVGWRAFYHFFFLSFFACLIIRFSCVLR